MRILIAVPTYESIFPDTFKSIYDLDVSGNDASFEFVRGYDCATARNKIAKLALDRGYDYVLMVDNDVVLPKDAIKNLLDDPKPVCLGYYAHRDSDNVYRGRTCVCKLLTETGSRWKNYPLESEYTAAELHKLEASGEYKVRIHGGGMGCAMIQTSVFSKIGYPWYDWVNYDSGKMLSEDLFFCEKCKKNSIMVHTDTRVNCGHILRRVQFAE